MQAYKKRAKGSWNQGKGCKGDGHERQFSKREISEQLAEAEENYLVRYHKGARNKNLKARLEYRVRWYEERLTFWKGKTSSSMENYFRDAARKARKELREKFPDKKGQV